MAGKIPTNISSRTKRILDLAAAKLDDSANESDEDLSSGESYVPDENEIYSSDHNSASELDADLCESEDQPCSNSENIETPDDEVADNLVDAEHKPEVTYHGKRNCFEWSSKPVCSATQTVHANIIKVRLSKLQGPAVTLGNNPTPEEVWRLLITNEMVENIVKHTNIKLESMRSKISNKSDCTYKNTDTDEINALIGLFVLCSIFKSSRESLRSLFSTSSTGRPIFRATMTEKRCFVLTRALRFDDAASREERRKENPAAAVSEIFSTFILNCQTCYALGAHVCVDETLVPFRGRVRFLVYMPKKPAKYGIKLLCMTDAHSSYLYNAYIYCGKESDGSTLSAEERKLQIPTQAVVRLTKCIFKTNRNVTFDNWFTSLEVAQHLSKNGLTIVGTMRSNKPQIPPTFLPNKNKQVGTSMYGFTKEFTIVSYVPKKMKAVVLLSSMHHSAYNDTTNDKPEIVSFYNATKSGVDTMDMKCSNYSTNRKTRRWPLAIFYYILNIAESNAYNLYKLYPNSQQISRYEFLRKLGLSLVNPYLRRRLTIPNLTKELVDLIEATLGEQSNKKQNSVIKSDKLEKRKACRYCPYKKKRATMYKCIECETPTCLQCSKKICNECIK